MLQKLKDFWNNPYSAPLTEPLRNVGGTVAKVLSPYIECVEDAYEDRWNQGGSFLSRVFSDLVDCDKGDGFQFLNVGSMVVGAFAAGVGGGMAGWAAVAAAGVAAKVAVAGVAALAAGTLGVLAAPVVLVTGIAAGAAVVGTVIGVVPGIVGGVGKAIKHHKALKNPPPAPAAAPSPQQVQQSARQNAMARILVEFNSLDAKAQWDVVEMLGRSAKQHRTYQEQILDMATKIAAERRPELVEALEQTLSDAFAVVARKKAAEVAQLNEDIAVKPFSAKLRRRNATPANG